jgi:hypothetical protein
MRRRRTSPPHLSFSSNFVGLEPDLTRSGLSGYSEISTNREALMHKTVIVLPALLLIVGLTQTTTAASSAPGNDPNTQGSKGVTVDDLGKGLKSAAHNIEKEIPRMGSVIGNALKKITDKRPGTRSSEDPITQSK